MLLLQKIVKLLSLHNKILRVLVAVGVIYGNTILFAPLAVRAQVYFGQVQRSSSTNSTGTGHVHNHGSLQPSATQRTATFGNKVKAFFGFDERDPYSQPPPNNMVAGGNSHPAQNNSLPPRSGSTLPQSAATQPSSSSQTIAGNPGISTNTAVNSGESSSNVSSRLRSMRSNVFEQEPAATSHASLPATAAVADTRTVPLPSSSSPFSSSQSSLSPPAVARTTPKLSPLPATSSSTARVASTGTAAGLATTNTQPTLMLPRPSLAHDVGLERDDTATASAIAGSSQTWSLRSSPPTAPQPQRTLTSRPAAVDEVAVLPEPLVAVQTTPRTVPSESRPELPPLGHYTLDDQPDDSVAESRTVTASPPTMNLPPLNPQQLPADRRNIAFDAQEEAMLAELAKENTLPSVSSGLSDSRNSGLLSAETPIKKIPDRNILLSRQSPLLEVEMTGPNRTDVGVEAKYQCRILNAGGAMAEQVVLAVELPVWATIAGAEASSGVTDVTMADNDTHLFQWNIRQIAPHDSENLVLRVIPRQGKPIELKVGYDFKRQTTRTVIEVHEPKLEMAIDGPTSMLAGMEGVYWLRLRNTGNGEAVNVELALLPAAGDLSEPSRHTIPMVRAGEEQVLEIRAAEKRNDVLDIRVQATLPNGLRTETVKQVAILRPQLNIEVESPEFLFAGNQAEYRLRVRNNGTAPTGRAELTAAMPATAKYIMADQDGQIIAGQNTVVWTVDNLSVGTEQVCTLVCELHQEGKSELDVVVTEPIAGKVTATAVTQVEAIANVSMKIDTPQGPVEVGKDTPYVVTVTNHGSKTASNIDVRCAFVAAVDPIRIENGSGVINNGMVLFERIGALPPGQSRTFRFIAIASKPGAHKIRVEMESAAADSHFVHEGSTLFYQKGRSVNGEMNIAKPSVAPPTSVPSPSSSPSPSPTSPNRMDVADRRLTTTAPSSSVPSEAGTANDERDGGDTTFPWPSVTTTPAEETTAPALPTVSTLPANPIR